MSSKTQFTQAYDVIQKGIAKQQEIQSLKKAMKEKDDILSELSEEWHKNYGEFLIMLNRYNALVGRIVEGR